METTVDEILTTSPDKASDAFNSYGVGLGLTWRAKALLSPILRRLNVACAIVRGSPLPRQTELLQRIMSYLVAMTSTCRFSWYNKSTRG